MIAPYDAEDARGLLKASIRDPDPVVFLENEILYGTEFPIDEKVLDKDFTVPIGKCKASSQPAKVVGLECSGINLPRLRLHRESHGLTTRNRRIAAGLHVSQGEAWCLV